MLPYKHRYSNCSTNQYIINSNWPFWGDPGILWLSGSRRPFNSNCNTNQYIINSNWQFSGDPGILLGGNIYAYLRYSHTLRGSIYAYLQYSCALEGNIYAYLRYFCVLRLDFSAYLQYSHALGGDPGILWLSGSRRPFNSNCNTNQYIINSNWPFWGDPGIL